MGIGIIGIALIGVGGVIGWGGGSCFDDNEKGLARLLAVLQILFFSAGIYLIWNCGGLIEENELDFAWQTDSVDD